MGIFGYDSVEDMFDGGGAGGSSKEGYGRPGESAKDYEKRTEDKTVVHSSSSSGSGSNSSSNDKPSGSAPSGITKALSYVTPVGIIGKLAGWANNLNPEEDIKKGSVVDGKQVYNNGSMSYSYNFLGLPYEVKVEGGKVIDALSIKDPKTGLTGYEQKAKEARDRGDNDQADAIMQEAEDNSAGEENSVETTAESIKEMAIAAGVVSNEADMAAIIADPNKFLADKGLVLADIIPKVDADAEGTNLNADDASYGLGENDGYTATTTGDASTVDPSIADNKGAATFEAATNNLTDNEMMNAATGTVSDDALVDADKYAIDVTGAATGVNADGTKNELGIAANDWANVDLSKVIDTSTVAGKLLADKLVKEGKEFVDAKTSILWQMKTIAAEFKDANGNPIIPPWAQGMNREAMKSITFNGISGTAATAAMSNAIMESMMGVAEKEATFFQTLTVKNLDNKQEAIINKAKMLSNVEMANLDARSQAAVQNAKAFLQMDIANLTNEQQAEMINKQALVQSMLENTKAENAARRFNAEAANDMNKFYTEMVVNIQRHNTSEINALTKFNAGEINDAAQFNADMKNDRQQFLAEMQYQIDLANAKWRQEVQTTNTQNEVDAHTADVKAALDLTQEAQNNLWDSADNMLDYIWKTTDNDQERELRLLIAQMQAQSGQKSGNGFLDGLMKLGGAFVGSSEGSAWIAKQLGIT